MLNKSNAIVFLPAWKRGLDLTGATIGLMVLSPIMVLIAAFIKISSPGPVFFKHRRFGYRGKPFYVWKFRSMHVDVDPSRHQQHVLEKVQGNSELAKLDNPTELIPLGKWLRCSGIDELPQLINVIRGEMSLVGPRPDVIPENQYEDWQKVRFEVLPGMTGLWQISGKNSTTFQEMNQLDVQYVQKRSLWLDLKIILFTVPAILKLVTEDFVSKKFTTTNVTKIESNP
jgi:lipopolysaccharide/colanic/teichoic acid biosynthesis glycosyltransferase